MHTNIWTKLEAKGDIPPPREGGRMLSYNGYLYLFAGATTKNKENYTVDDNLYRFDTINNTWQIVSVKGSKPLPVFLFDIAIYEEYFYVFYGFNTVIGNDVNDIWRIHLNATEFAWEKLTIEYSDDQASFIPRDSFTLVIAKNEVYMFGGYTFIGLKNDLLKLVLPPIDGKVSWEVVSRLTETPLPRLGHAMLAINNNLVVIGGQGEDLKKLIDMWEYDLDTQKWNALKVSSKQPEARSYFSSTVAGNNIIIYGGESANELLGDAYIFDYNSRAWTQTEFTSGIQPAARKGSCISLYNKTLFIFGGMTDLGYSNELWSLDIPSRVVSFIENIGESPPALSYSFCDIAILDDRDYFIIAMGETTGNTPMSSIYKFDILSQIWIKEIDESPQSPYSRSMVSGAYMKDYVIFAGGQQWGSICRNEIFRYNLIEHKFEMLGELKQGKYSAGAVHYKDKLYIYAGGSAFGGLLRNNVPSADLIAVEDISEDKFVCSKGTYRDGERCVECDPGYYSTELEAKNCTECPPGSYVKISGSLSASSCMLCSEGFYTKQSGSSKCFNCPQDFTCPVGTVTPDQYYTKQSAFNTKQPEIYEGATEDVTYLSKLSQMIIGLIFIMVLCLIMFYKKSNQLLRSCDIYTHDHNYFTGDIMYVKKTALGGFFTLLFIGASLIMITSAMIAYLEDNVVENKALVPLITIEQEYKTIASEDLFIIFSFQNYGDSCEINGKCTDQLNIVFENIDGTFSDYVCEKIGYYCTVSISCKNCELESNGNVYLELTETNSYATAIFINVTLSSSIPDEYSSIDLNFFPEDNKVFMGNVPSNVELQFTPSVFLTDTGKWPDKVTGYHVTLLSFPSVGSTVYSNEIQFYEGLRVNLILTKDSTTLVTQRLLKQTPFILISAISGLVVGIMSLSQFLMTKVEKHFLKRKSRNKKLELKKKITINALQYVRVLPKTPRENNSDKSTELTTKRRLPQSVPKELSGSELRYESDSCSFSSPKFIKDKKYFPNYRFKA